MGFCECLDKWFFFGRWTYVYDLNYRQTDLSPRILIAVSVSIVSLMLLLSGNVTSVFVVNTIAIVAVVVNPVQLVVGVVTQLFIQACCCYSAFYLFLFFLLFSSLCVVIVFNSIVLVVIVFLFILLLSSACLVYNESHCTYLFFGYLSLSDELWNEKLE